MEKLQVLNTKGEKVSDINLNKEIWGIEPNDAVLYDALRLARNNFRQGTADTKTRSEVSGGGRKPWRQKGTGNARQGSIRAPQWIKGGVVFAPKPRDFSKKVNKQMKRAAFVSALSTRVAEKNFVVVENLEVSGKTKEMAKILENLGVNSSAVVITLENNDNVIRASANLANITTTTADIASTYDIVSNAKVVITKDAVKEIEKEYAV